MDGGNGPGPAPASWRLVALGGGAHIFSAAHAPVLSELGVDVVGVHDPDASRAADVAARWGWPACDGLDELLAVPADAAVVTAPHPAHAHLVRACLAAGKHVLVEKPLAATAADVDAIVEQARQHGLVVAVALQHRLRSEVRLARRLIDEGWLGGLHRAMVTSYYPKRDVYYRVAPWRGTWSGAGGGVLLNQGQHDVDTLLHLCGMPRRCFARTRTALQATETEDTAEALLEWDDGATGSLHVSSAANGGGQRIVLVGTGGKMILEAGMLQFERNEQDITEFARGDGGPFDQLGTVPEEPYVGCGGTHEELYRDFLDALASGRAPVAPADDARGAVEVTNAVALSSHTDRPVAVPVDRDAYRSFVDEVTQESAA